MSFVRWFNRVIEPVPVTLTLLVGGLVVIPAAVVLIAWVGIWLMLGPAAILEALR